MKIYEDLAIYLPFVYLLVNAIMIGSFFHSTRLASSQPFVVIFFVITNTLFFSAVTNTRKKNHVLKTSIHKSVWKMVLFSVYGILFNDIHLEMFRDHLLDDDKLNVVVSFLYLVSVNVARKWFNKHELVLVANLVFLLIPLRRMWKVNLYMYVLFCSCSIYVTFRRVHARDVKQDRLHYYVPVLDYFVYNRINDYMVFVGFFQLYSDLYSQNLNDVQEVEVIRDIMLEEKRSLVSDVS